MVIYRGRVVLTSHFSPTNEGRKHEVARFFRVWDRRALLIRFLAGVLTGLGLGLMARALHLPGFVKCITFEIAVEVSASRAVAIASRCGTTAMPMVAPSERRLADYGFPLSQPPMKLRGKETRSQGGRGESPEPLSGHG